MKNNAISLRKFAEQNDITYTTAHRHWLRGNIEGMQLPTGKILVYGWKKDFKSAGKEQQAIVFIRVPKGKDPAVIRTKLHEYANLNKIAIEKEIIWEAYMFQNNPYLEDLYNSNNKFIIASSMTDIYGINFNFLEKIFASNGIITIALSDPRNIPSLIYKTIVAGANMAKAAVGMSHHKKEISDSNFSILE